MASDSDEEDRLLQMALKEQEERDLTYQKPPRSTKPVVNMVQQPATRSNQRNTGSKANSSSRGNPGKPKGRARAPSRDGDDDDDSEVELLSISSGDEDSSKDRVGPVKSRTGGSERRSSRDDGEFGWDDDEPRSWKRVDEAELARMVRDMRETRAAPAVDQKAVAMARKGLTSIQSLPKGVEVLDPLGLGVIDNKSLRLITASSTSTPVSRDKSDLDAASREKILYSSPNFDPKAFLARVHQETSAADLESGALTLKTDLKGRTQQKKQLVKENFDCFVSCKTTIDDIESKLRQIEEDPEGAGTAHLYEVTQRISSVANRAFQPLFERQAQADKIRSVQGMLQRFRTLFNLPSSIRGSIKKGEYDLAVREYRKAKSIVLPSHVGILKRVLEEVDKVMHEFRGMLYKSMENPLLDLAELENIVRLLLELEPDSDPVWHYLNIQNRRIRGLFEKCTIDHEARMETLQNRIREKLQSDARWRQLQEDSNKSLEVDLSTVEAVQLDTHTTSLMGEEADTLRASYIRRLAAVLLQHIPAFWRLALSVFSGKFAKSTAGNVIHDAEANGKLNGNKTEEKSGETKYSNHTLEEVASMVNSTLSVLDAKVQATFRDFEESNILSPYMSDTIKEIAKACQSLEGKDSSPPSAVKILRGLHFEMTKVYIIRLCSWMRTTTREISSEEVWVTLSTLERNKSPYAISYMPLEFRELIISSMDRIDIMLQYLRNETSKYDISEPLHEIQESVRLAFLNSFLDFAGYLEGLGGELIALSKSNRSSINLHNSYLHGLESDIALNGFGEGASDMHRKLLIVLSNIGYCKEELSCDLYNKYKNIWLRAGDENNADMRDLTTSFLALEEKVLEQYTFAKSNVIRNAALKYLLDSGVQWGAAPAVKGIRDATIELLHILVAVHAEVYSGAKPLLEKTLTILVEGLIDTYLSLFHESKSKGLKSLDTNGFCQLMLELDYFETVLNAYFSQEAHQALKSLQGNLLDKACESASDETPGHHRRPTRGSDDPMADDRSNPSVSADDLLALAQQYSNDLLEGELERTRLNISCFIDSSLPVNYAPPPPQPAPVVSAPVAPKPMYPSFREGSVASPSFRRQQNSPLVGSPAVSRRRR
ncbi:exocyst complex component SEC5A-like [Carex rostrata]